MTLLATAPFGHARRPPLSHSAMSVILPYIAPLLLLLETNTEANVGATGAGEVEAALS